ncbi:Gp19/Gp15/Gp42 family protein [Nocardia sp. IFM 10818]
MAAPPDVASRLGRELTPEETTQVATLLADAELLIRARIKNLDELITSGAVDRAIVVMVEANAVMRVIRNPEGFKSEVDGNYSYEFAASVASGRLEILDYEWSLLGVSERIFFIHPRLPRRQMQAPPNFWVDLT